VPRAAAAMLLGLAVTGAKCDGRNSTPNPAYGVAMTAPAPPYGVATTVPAPAPPTAAANDGGRQ
jgi:hypothetical protein